MLEIKMCDHCTNHEYFFLTTITERRSHEIDKRSPVLVKPSQVQNIQGQGSIDRLVKVARKLKLLHWAELNIDDRSALSAQHRERALA